MKKLSEDQHPDYVQRRLEGRGRLIDVLLVEGTLCAAAIGMLVLMPAGASVPPPAAPPAVLTTHRVCTPAFTSEELDDEPAAAELGTSRHLTSSCAASARPTLLVRQDKRQPASLE
ncbi:hypothetical protein ACO2RV_14880 [Ancylobacter sp. VNQ12]|uniref:hypothetical protein n=1 Tax=Ancylobacter sp. VNQ12 TaxID=3400920 RepID=UPI003C1002D1